VFEKPFSLAYVVTLAKHQLSTGLHVRNLSPSADLDFQALLHTYLAVPANEVSISPLTDLTYYDKTEDRVKKEMRDLVDVKKYTDSVYENAPLKYDVIWKDGAIEVRAKNFKDVVVWNPQQEGKNIGDMEEGGW
jgi:glucose-6-phosphate 1-epimerase